MDNHQKSHIKHLHEAYLEGRLSILAGAGVSANSGVPTWGTLIQEMKLELPEYVQNETDYLKVAQLYKDARGDAEYMHKVKTVLKHNQVVPNIIHKAILDLEPSQIITPNYDNLFEQAIANEYRQYDTICEDRDLTQMHYPRALIKMHGDFERGNIVLSETDYFHYKHNFSLIRAMVLSILASKVVLFTGFSFADLNLKLILDDVQSVLQNKMQRIYLLSDSRPDVHTQRYFENKGINIVFLEDNDLDNIYVSNEDMDLSDPRGIKLHKTLLLIRKFTEQSEDPITTISNILDGYSPYIKVFGEGLRYIFPDSLTRMWNLHSHELNLHSDFFKSLRNDISSFTGLLKFRRKYPEIDLKKLQEIAFLNYIFEIDGLTLMSRKRMRELSFRILEPAHDALFNFDFEKINKELKHLSSKPLRYTIDDLEYPFLLYKLGDYIGAYEQYGRILPHAWKTQKYILYFICLFNMAALRKNLNSWPVNNPRHIDTEKIQEKLLDIYERLDSTLNMLPIEEPIRRIFRDLLSNRAIGAKVLEIDALREDILEHKHISQRGGFSLNGHAAALEGTYIRESNFCNYNYIILENNTNYRHLCKNTVVGMLNSFSIEESTQSEWIGMRQSKISSFEPYELKPMIFNITPKELRKIISLYDIKDLVLHEDSVKYINECLDNLTKDSDQYIDIDLFIRYIGSLLVVIINSEKFDLNVKNLYDFIIKYWDHYIFREQVDYGLKRLVYTYPPETNQADQLINKIIYDSAHGRNFRGAVIELVRILSKDKSYKLFLDFSKIRKDEVWDMIYPIYPLVATQQKQLFADEAQSNIQHYGLYFDFLVSYSVVVTNKEKFKKHLNISDSIEEIIAHCCCNIAKMLNNATFSNIQETIKNFIQSNECTQFMLDPIGFTQKDKVKESWLLACETPMEELVKIPEFLELYKEALKHDKFTKYGKDHLLGLWRNAYPNVESTTEAPPDIQ